MVNLVLTIRLIRGNTQRKQNKVRVKSQNGITDISRSKKWCF